MESWSSILSHIAAFIAGIALTGYFARLLWRKASMPAHDQSPVAYSESMIRTAMVVFGIYFGILAVSFGLWLDHPGDLAWAFALLVISIAAVCIFAWCLVRKVPSSRNIKKVRTG